jgi:hypothetical protein
MISNTTSTSLSRGYLSSVEGVAHFGSRGEVGVVDSVLIIWPDGKATKTNFITCQ